MTACDRHNQLTEGTDGMGHPRKVAALLLSLLFILSLAPAYADDPSRGRRAEAQRRQAEVIENLDRAAPGSECAGPGYEMRSTRGRVICTHGPDPAPAGTDITQSPTVAELQEATFGSPTGSGTENPVPCVGDGQTGNRVQAIYAYIEGNADRSAEIVPMIRQWAWDSVGKVVQDSAVKTDGTRYVRFAMDKTQDACTLSVKTVALSSAAESDFNTTVNELAAAGYNASNRKYLVWMDATYLCGIGQMYVDDRPSQDNHNNQNGSFIPGMVARTDSGCWADAGGSGLTPVEAHELFHTLGAVQETAPRATSQGHCTDDYDVMCYDDEVYIGGPAEIVCTSESTEEVLLDCNNDDYFHTNPPDGNYLHDHWNTADSSFLSNDLEACTHQGTSGNDVLVGTSGKDIMCGEGGNDTFKGLGGDDLIFGGLGKDKADYSQVTSPIKADLAVDSVSGSAVGNDTLGSVEVVVGGKKADELFGNDAANTLIGGGGDDYITGAGGNDKLAGAAGNDSIEGGLGSDRIDGGKGIDEVSYFMSESKMTINLDQGKATGEGTDTLIKIEDVTGAYYEVDKITGSNGPNYVVAGGGNDYVYGLGGDDVVFGGDGSDHVYGGGGNYDFLSGGNHGDFLYGEAGMDGFDGGSGTDKCVEGGGPVSGYRNSCERK